ncbi:hypothetical protein V5799_011323 [Amblyomma americanum]|uniref:Uncharacterized protein n=1 Tax=Amblyomma americanum TaxID=6943 RepID=A0AAQ4EI91_AMBAM
MKHTAPLSSKLKDAGDSEDGAGRRIRQRASTSDKLSCFAINQMEHRLINQRELQWFDNEGTVASSPCVITDKPCRLWGYDDESEAFKPKYMKALTCVPYHCDAELELELELDVSSLRFDHHPLFSAEHVLVAQLTGLYEAYAALALSGDYAPLSCKDKASNAAY